MQAGAGERSLFHRLTLAVGARGVARGRAALRVTWILTPRRGATEVDLAAQLQTGPALARLVRRPGRGRRTR